jgi:hypothetical protein
MCAPQQRLRVPPTIPQLIVPKQLNLAPTKLQLTFISVSGNTQFRICRLRAGRSVSAASIAVHSRWRRLHLHSGKRAQRHRWQ